MARNGFSRFIVVLIIVAALVIGGGVLYLYRTTSNNPPQLPAPQPISQSGPATSTATPLSPENHPEATAQFTDDQNIAARSLSIINTTTTFTLKDFPDAQFKILAVVKATGGVPASILTSCSSSGYHYKSYIFVSLRQPGASPPGICLSGQNADGSPNSVVVVDMDIVNNGGSNVGGSFLRVFYSQTTNGITSDRLAEQGLYSGGTGPFSSRRSYEILNVPADKNEIRLVFGKYGGLDQYQGEELLSRSEGGFVVDFTKKTISEIQ